MNSNCSLRGSKLYHHDKFTIMRFLHSVLPSLLLLGVSVAEAAASWKFEDASVSISGKGGAGSGSKDKYVNSSLRT